jgi:UDP-N-acetyl-D-glucosamine dehydrogenase
VSTVEQDLCARIDRREARAAVVGAGYVGLPLAVEIARAGFHVAAVDLDARKVAEIGAGRSYVPDVPSSAVRELVASGRLGATTDLGALGAMDLISVCVPTPLNKTKDPDVSHVVEVGRALRSALRPGQLVVLESTTYPGFTREVFLPLLAESGLAVGRDYFLAFSPERVDPGNPRWHTRNTPKILGGATPGCLAVARRAYETFVDRIVAVSSTDSAEMVKLLENTFRAVNIGLVNEVALMCRKLGLDTWEVIDAAATKPFGFMPFYPGPGLGGHCIPVDPHYLSWKLKTLKYNARFIELAGEVNSAMPEVVAQVVVDALNEERKAAKGARVLVLGVAYKRDIDDVRESPALDLMEILHARGAELSYHDPHVPALSLPGLDLRSVDLDQGLERTDCTVIVTDHRAIDWDRVAAGPACVVDTRNALRGRTPRGRLWRL